MKKILLAPLLMTLSACGSTYVSNDDLVGNLSLSDGHSQCISTRLKALLDTARVVEVIPRSRKCSAIEEAKSAVSGSTYSCPRPETSVHFGRLSNTALTDSLEQDGWVSDKGPTRIARTVKGDYAVFLPRSEAIRSLPDGQCNVFERKVRAGLATHLAYAAALKEQGLR